MTQNEKTDFMLGPLLFLMTILFINFCARMIFSPLLVTLETEFGVSHAEAGRFFLFLSAPYGIMMLFSGFVSQTVRHRGSIFLSIMIASTGVFLVSQSSSLVLFKTGLIVTGLGGGLYAPSGLATITSLADAKHWGKAFSIHEIGPIMGFVLAPIIAELGITFGSWRFSLIILSICGWLVGLLFIIFGKGGTFKGEPPLLSNLKKVFSIKEFWIISVFFILMIGLEMGVYAMLPTFLMVEKGMERETVNVIVSVSRLSGLGVMFLSGFLVDRIGEKILIGWICGLSGLFTVLIGLTDGVLLIGAVFLQPMVVATFFPAFLTALSKLIPPRMRNVATSVLIPFGYLFGGGVAPSFLGFLADLGYFPLGIILLGGIMIAALPLLRTLRIARKLVAAED